MSPWILPVLIFATWSAACIASASQKAVDDAKQKVPEDQRGGVSILPTIPIVPLFFWGLAWAIDLVAAPWGTYCIGGFHSIILTVSISTILYDLWLLNGLDNNK
ncbi:MAG: hypothetical protein KDA70_11785 [Planctomycetaceae bacterium]|nr:hypothetical protein [Planctomycetaceae bacterium]MCA9019558.1 hypothetical protein [Planctomycetaceae bacterium]